MARQLRIEFPCAFYHVTAWGNARQDIFLDDEDRQRFLEMLTRVVSRFHLRLYAYCLMDNHFHLVVETPKANLSKAMRQLNSVYTQFFNRRHGRSATCCKVGLRRLWSIGAAICSRSADTSSSIRCVSGLFVNPIPIPGRATKLQQVSSLCRPV